MRAYSTCRYHRAFRLTFLLLTSRIGPPAPRFFKIKNRGQQHPMSTNQSSAIDQLSTEDLGAKLNPNLLPKHVAIIMDGNGRWAEARYLPRIAGHREGVKSIREITQACSDLGIQALTIYAFSHENWNRPAHETSALMNLLEDFLAEESRKLIEHGIRFRTIGRIKNLPASTIQRVHEAEQATAHLDRLHLTVALSYGGRAEIVDAVREILREVQKGTLQPDKVDEAVLQQHLYTQGLPDPDLLIRTSGETRISNFLLWQLAYAELYFTPTLWPDFRRHEFLLALLDYQGRERRFGRVLSRTTSS